MKKSLFLSRILSILTITAVTVGSYNAYAGIMHTDATYQTYTDFGQNCGRYVTGTKVNALLDHIRTNVDGGIKITYTDGTAPYVISNEQGMIDFRATDDIGAQVAVSPTFAATVHHNGPISASYGGRTVGDAHAINYQSIDIRHSNVFRLHPTTSDHDFMMQRQSKLQTDAVWNPVTTVRDMKSLEGQHVYHSGSGSMGVYDESKRQELGLAGAYTFIIGAINEVTFAENYTGHTHIRVQQNTQYYNNGIGACLDNPLPNAIRGGDSGSPIFIYNSENQRYEFIASQQSGAGTFGQALGDMEWMEETLASFNKTVDMSSSTTVYLNAINQSIETRTDNDGNSGDIYEGSVTDSSDNVLVTYRGVKNGQNTWSDLSDIKDNDAWYAWDGHLEQEVTDLFFNENLVFFTGENVENNNIILNADVDLGIGYVEFNEGRYTISSVTGENGETYQLDSAGYVLNEGSEVHVKLVNTDIVAATETVAEHTRMTEWRAMGEGSLYIDGTGDTNALLNLGGKSTTYLLQTNGHAAYNVLVNTGATVVIKDATQIERDFTFGSGGGTLDLNGNDFTWDNDQSIDADGFTIHALTEEAVISNNAENTVTLTVSAPQDIYKGSFTGNLDIVYTGSNQWTLNSIHTELDADRSLTVNSGTVTLVGTNTVHGMGSLSATNANRLVNTRDWHYADAAMNVNVAHGGTFELGSHARLTGNVNVATGGTFLMREGVQYEQEFVEGGQILEDTADYAAFYGLKGNVQLASGAEMQIKYNSGVTATQTYSGHISGAGNLSVELGTDGATLIFGGDNSNFTGVKNLISGTLVAQGLNALGDCSGNKWQIQSAGVLAVDGNAITQDILVNTVAGSSTGVLALTQDQTTVLKLDAHQGLIIGAMLGETVHYGSSDSSLAAYDHDNNSTTDDVWQIGGGGGTLVVDAKLTGRNDLILGNEYGKGVVKLTNTANEIGNIIFTGQVTLDYTGAEALGDSTLTLLYTNRVYAHDNTANVGTASAGVLLVDKIASTDFDLSEHKTLYLGSEGDAILSGNIKVADGETFKFGGITGKLTVMSALSAGHGLVVDGQTYSGGIVHMQNATAIDQSVLIIGYDSDKTDLTGGDITLSFGADNALASATSVTVTQGGILDIAGTSQSLQNLIVTASGSVVDSVGFGTLTLNQGTLEGTVSLSNLTKTGGSSLNLSGSSQVDNLNLEAGMLVVNGSVVIGEVHIHGGDLTLTGNSYRIGVLEVHEGATFDIKHGASNVNADSIGERIPQIVLSGGTLANTGNDIGDGSRQFYMVALTQDSTVHSASRFGIVGSGHAETGIDLAGHTLTKSGGDLFEMVNTSITAGTINVTAGELWFRDKNKEHDSTIEASITSNGGSFCIDKTGAGALTLSGEITQIKSVGISSGTIAFVGKTAEVASLNIHSTGTVNISGADATVNVDSINIGNDSGDTQANFVLNSGRLNVGSGGITNRGTGVFTVNNGTLGTKATSWTSNQAMTITGGLTIDSQVVGAETPTAGTITFTGDVTGTGSITKTGLGSVKFEGTTDLQNIDVQTGNLNITGTVNVGGNINITQGATLTLNGGFVLSEGKTFSVLSNADSSAAAVFNATLSMDGGTLVFDGSTLKTDAAALTLSGLSGSTVNISFDNAACLSTGSSYILATGDWSSITVSGTGTGYMAPTFNRTSSGLSVYFGVQEGHTLWNGLEGYSTWDADSFAQKNGAVGTDVAVFNDSAVVKTVSVSGAMSAGGIVFDSTLAYMFTGDDTSSIETTTLDMSGTGRMEMHTDLVISTSADICGTLAMEEGILNAASAAVTVQEGAVLLLTGDGHSIGTLNAASGLVLLNNATLALGANTHSLPSISADGENAINLVSGATLNRVSAVSDSGSVVLTGAGTYVMGAGKTTFADSGSLSLHDTEWTGTVELASEHSHANALNGINLNDYGNADSTVRLKGVLGSLDANGDAPVEFASNIEMVNTSWAALELNNGQDGDAFVFSGDITSGSGSGNFVKSNDASQSFTFSGDVSSWKGHYRVVTGENHLTFSGKATTINLSEIYTESAAKGITTVTFENENAVTVNAAITQKGNTTVNVVADAASGITFSKNLNVSNMTVENGAVSLNGSTHSFGTLSAAASEVTAKQGSTLSLGSNTHSIGKLNAGSATVSLNGSTLNLGSNAHSIGAISASGDNVLYLAGDSTLSRVNSVSGDGSVTLSGSGTYIMGGGKTAFVNSGTLSLHDSDWTGTVELTSAHNYTYTFTDLDLNNYGNADSTVRLVGILGSLAAAEDGTPMIFTSDIEMVNNSWAALDLNSGTGKNMFIFTGDISGGGYLFKNNAAIQSFSFTGDVSEWKGKYRVMCGENHLTFSGNATTINLTEIYTQENAEAPTTATVTFQNDDAVTVSATIRQEGNSTLNVVADAAGGTTFAKNVTVGTLTAEQGPISLNGTTNSIGTLSAGESTVNLNSGSTLNLGGNAHSIGTLNGSGTVTSGTSEATLTVAGGEYSGNIAGSLGLIKIGNGTLALGGNNNTFSGGTTITGGVLKLGAGVTLGSGNVAVNEGSTLDLTDYACRDTGTGDMNLALVNLMNSISGAGTVILNADTEIQTTDQHRDNVNILSNYIAGNSLVLNSWAIGNSTWRTWTVGNGGSITVGDGSGSLNVRAAQQLIIQDGGIVNVGELKLGHEVAGNPGSLVMSGENSKLTVSTILGNAAKTDSFDNDISITGGTFKVTGTQAVGVIDEAKLNVHIGGADSAVVTLQTAENDWVLDGSSANLGSGTMTIGNVVIDAGNEQNITFKNALVNGSIVNNASLTLGEGIASSGDALQLALNKGSVLNVETDSALLVSMSGCSSVNLAENASMTLDSGSHSVGALSNNGTLVLNGALTMDSAISGTGTVTVNSTLALTDYTKLHDLRYSYTDGVTEPSGFRNGFTGSFAEGTLELGENGELLITNFDNSVGSIDSISDSGFVSGSLFDCTIYDVNDSHAYEVEIMQRATEVHVNSDGTLVFGVSSGSDAASTTVDPLTASLVLNGGSAIWGARASTIAHVFVTADSDFTVFDMNRPESQRSLSETLSLNTVDVESGSTLTINKSGTASWKQYLNIGVLTGAGTVHINGPGSTNDGEGYASYHYVESLKDFSGDISIISREANGKDVYHAAIHTGTEGASMGALTVAGFGQSGESSSFTFFVEGETTLQSMALSDAVTVQGSETNLNTLTTDSLSMAVGGTYTFDGIDLTVNNAAATSRFLDSGNNTTTINLKNGAVVDDRESYYSITGTLNLTAAGTEGGTIYVDGIRLTDQHKTASYLNIAAGTHLIITGDSAMDSNAQGNGSFALTHWDDTGTVNVEGVLTSNAILSAWDGPGIINVQNGGKLNLLNGLARTDRGTSSSVGNKITVNVEEGASIYAKGGAYSADMTVNLKAGATLGGIADAEGGTANYANNMNIGTVDSSGAVVFDTSVKAADAETYMLDEGCAGNVVLSGTTTVQGTPTVKVTGGGKLWLADGATESSLGMYIAANDGSGVAEISGVAELTRDGATINLAGLEDNKAIVANTLIDIMENSTLNMSNVVIQDSSRITDNPATFHVNNVVAAVTVGKNATTIVDGNVLNITSSLMDSVSVTGNDFTIDLSGDIDLTGIDYVSITFTSDEEGATAASFDTGMDITLQYDGNEYEVYFVEDESGITRLYAAVPEPGTATLSLLALAALAARRRRK